MTSILMPFRSLPYKQFRSSPHFYLWYDGAYAVGLAAATMAMVGGSWPGLVPEWTSWLLLALPFMIYAQICAHLFIHNATHKNWPPAINRWVGELCGIFVITRFASWEIVHQRHHAFSDDEDRDPHPIRASFWAFLAHSLVNVEAQLRNAYFDAHGDTPKNRRYELIRGVVSFWVGVLLVVTWYLFLGFAGFFYLFLPAALLGGLHVMHFNWITHNGASNDHDFRPVNLDHGLYWVGNRIFFGIYFHANHHRRPGVFNPMRMPGCV